MKILMLKHTMQRYCAPDQQELLQSAGWRPADTEQVREEVIRLKPAVKSKATVKALETANITNKGDE